MAKAVPQRRWRERHPFLSAWHHHRWNAKLRGIKVEWELEEFLQFCAMTGYIQLLPDGWTIDRIEVNRGYSLRNCQTLTRPENATKGNYERAYNHYRHQNPAAG